MTPDVLPDRVSRKIVVFGGSGCWQWVGAGQSNGYGRCWDGVKSNYAHRVVYQLINGGIPEGLDLDHLCRNRRCVNPHHLEPVTRSVNLRRGNAGENLAAPARAMTHCHKGHEFTEENTRLSGNRRHCRACARERYISKKVKENG